MNIDDIRLLYEYTIWADRRLVAACAALTPEQYAAQRPFGPFYRNLRETVVHTLNSERGWRLICQGSPVVDWDAFTPQEYPTPPSLEAPWAAEVEAMQTYLNGLSDADLLGVVRYQDDDIPRARLLWHCLHHMMNHSTQHRSEAAALLTMAGHSPGDFDFTLFLNHHFNLPG